MSRKKWTANILLVLIVTLVSACNNGEDADLSKEEVMEQTIAKAEEVDSYSIEVDIDVDVDWINETYDDSDSNISYVGDIYEPSEIAHYEGGFTDDVEMYFIEDELYATDSDNDEWIQDGSPAESIYKSIYSFQAQALESMEGLEDTDMDETNHHYELTYVGNDETVYEAFGMLSTLDDVEDLSAEHNTEMEVFISIRTDDLTIEEASWKTIYESEEGSVNTDMFIHFDNINEIEEIQVPQDLLNEVEQDSDGSEFF